jgi:hypothetical protein
MFIPSLLSKSLGLESEHHIAIISSNYELSIKNKAIPSAIYLFKIQSINQPYSNNRNCDIYAQAYIENSHI